jgi:two-component system, NtrC family, response regulator
MRVDQTKKRLVVGDDKAVEKVGPSLLVVDDDPGVHLLLQKVLRPMQEAEQLQIVTVSSVSEAEQVVLDRQIDVILLDKSLLRARDKKSSGIESVPGLLEIRPHMQIIIYSGSRDTQDVVRAMSLGASGYVSKSDPHELLVAQVKKAIHFSNLSRRNLSLERVQRAGTVDELVFESRSMKMIKAKLPALAESDRPVLLLGETGTGKTAVGKLIHQMRASSVGCSEGGFQYVNIRQFQANVVESELFGHEPGAFTGATARKLGFCELAHNGTLFIDEIGEAPLELQAKLLTVLSEGVFHRVGGVKPIKSSFKLICATNRDLQSMVEEGSFREDLYYRICALEVRVPSLIERKDDIVALVKHLVPKMSEHNRIPVSFEEIPSDYLEYLTQFPPRGNIRGLENAITRLLVNSPKDRFGRCVLSDWKAIYSVNDADRRSLERRKVVTTEDLMELAIEISPENFPGLDAIVDCVEKKIVQCAWNRLRKGKEVAKFLKRSPASVSVKYRDVVGRRANSSEGEALI